MASSVAGDATPSRTGTLTCWLTRDGHSGPAPPDCDTLPVVATTKVHRYVTFGTDDVPVNDFYTAHPVHG